jgi:hypothetical protein
MYEIVVVGDVDSKYDALRGLLQATLEHVAEIQTGMLKAISEKFGHSMEELADCVKENDGFVKQLKTKSGRAVVIKK